MWYSQYIMYRLPCSENAASYASERNELLGDGWDVLCRVLVHGVVSEQVCWAGCINKLSVFVCMCKQKLE